MPRWSHDKYGASPCWPTCKKTCEVVCKTIHSQHDIWWHVVFLCAEVRRRLETELRTYGWMLGDGPRAVHSVVYGSDMLLGHVVNMWNQKLSHGLQDEAKQFWFKPALSKERHAIRSTSPRTPFTIRRRKSGHWKGLWIKPVDMSVGAHEAIRSWAMGHEVKGSILAYPCNYSVGRLAVMNMHPC